MRFPTLPFCLPLVLFLVACGTTSGGTSHIEVESNPALQPPVAGTYVGVGPIYRDFDSLWVESLETFHSSGYSLYLSYGTIQDGTGRTAEYLAHDAGAHGRIRRFGLEPPTVVVAEGTEPYLVRETLSAVQTINASLPDSWQLRFASHPAATNAVRPPDGQIVVEFQPREEWPPEHAFEPEAGSLVRRFYSPDGSDIVSGHIWMDVGRLGNRYRRRDPVLFREILHTLGRNLLDGTQFPNTIMNEPPERSPLYVLHPLDREALLAVYGWLGPGTTTDQMHERLGPWSEESRNLVGEFAVPCPITAECETALLPVIFGVSARNGLIQPWTQGVSPSRGAPYDSDGSGVAFWAGHLVGFTPTNRAVVGEASLELDTETLHGELVFRNLESWTAEPGAPGTGNRWGDGDLDYTVAVREDTLVSIAGDEGVITGRFSGSYHDGMAGVLERDDLKAAFGGERWYDRNDR